MKIINPFGPTLAKVRIPKNIIKKINLEVDKIIISKELIRKNDYSKRVVGQVYQEIRLQDKFKNKFTGLWKDGKLIKEEASKK